MQGELRAWLDDGRNTGSSIVSMGHCRCRLFPDGESGDECAPVWVGGGIEQNIEHERCRCVDGALASNGDNAVLCGDGRCCYHLWWPCDFCHRDHRRLRKISKLVMTSIGLMLMWLWLLCCGKVRASSIDKQQRCQQMPLPVRLLKPNQKRGSSHHMLMHFSFAILRQL